MQEEKKSQYEPMEDENTHEEETNLSTTNSTNEKQLLVDKNDSKQNNKPPETKAISQMDHDGSHDQGLPEQPTKWTRFVNWFLSMSTMEGEEIGTDEEGTWEKSMVEKLHMSRTEMIMIGINMIPLIVAHVVLLVWYG